LEVGAAAPSTEVIVRSDPRIAVTSAELRERYGAVTSVNALARPQYEAGRALQRLTRQLSAIRELIDGHEDAPDAVEEPVKQLEGDIRRLRLELSRAGRNARVGGAIEGWSGRPTADQMWQVGRAWERIPELVGQVNDIIETRLPALHTLLDEHGIRPDPGKPVAVPRRPDR
jgi:hypothetical protein